MIAKLEIASTAMLSRVITVGYDLSRIECLKRKIIEIIKQKGEFLRIKNFVDIISKPMLEMEENLLDQSRTNSAQGRTILEKRRQLENWAEGFHYDAYSRINSLIAKIRSDLNAQIAAFAEAHFSDPNADKAWNRLLEERNIKHSCQEAFSNLEMKVNDKLREISREINNELKFTATFHNDRALKMDKLFDGKRLWDWSGLILSGGLSIAAIIASLMGATIAGPLGVAALVVGIVKPIGSKFFESRKRKEYEARTKLENKLREHVTKLTSSLQKQMLENLAELETTRIKRMFAELNKLNAVIFKLADTQRNLAWQLNDHLLELNMQIVKESIRLIGAEGLEYHVQSVARVPGNSTLILLRDGTKFPEAQREKLYRLMAEKINFVFETDNKKILISRVLGRQINRDSISIEEKIGVAHIPLEYVTPDLINKVHLAQQFSKVQILKQ